MNAKGIQDLIHGEPESLQLVRTSKNIIHLPLTHHCLKCNRTYMSSTAQTIHFAKTHSGIRQDGSNEVRDPLQAYTYRKVPIKVIAASPYFEARQPEILKNLPKFPRAVVNVRPIPGFKRVEVKVEPLPKFQKVEVMVPPKFKRVEVKVQPPPSDIAVVEPVAKPVVKNEVFPCEICGQILISNASRRAHRFRIHSKTNHRCKVCGVKWTDHRRVKNHAFDREEPGEEPQEPQFICDFCGASFMYKYPLQRHMQEYHLRFLPLICRICNKTLSTGYSFDSHMKIHSEQIPCPLCGKIERKSRMTQHLIRHGVKLIDCPRCNMKFVKESDLTEHLNGHPEPSRASETGTARKFICDLCGKEYHRLAALKYHIDRMHTQQDPIPCKVCKKMMPCKWGMYQHMMSHKYEGQKELCQICGKYYAKHTLATHMLIHGEKTFECKVCGKRFSQGSGLSIHQKSHVIINAPCEICGKTFASKHKLYLHKRGVHKIKAKKGTKQS